MQGAFFWVKTFFRQSVFFNLCVLFTEPGPDNLIPELFEYRVIEAAVKPKTLKHLYCAGICLCSPGFFKFKVDSLK